jgi:hypothetical protein
VTLFYTDERLRRLLKRLDRTGLSTSEVKERIENYLEKRGVPYKKNIAFGNKKKLHYVFKNNNGETIGVYLLLWWRPITYKAIFDLIDWTNKEEITKLIVVCRIMGERAREVIEKEKNTITYILESWFRKREYNPLMAAF